MKPGVLFELKNIGKPLAWIRAIRFLSVKRHYRHLKFKDTEYRFKEAGHRTCLIWKPELFEPKVRR